MSSTSFDAIVIGAGPAGLTAGIYLARAKMRTLILNEGTVGGQLVLTHEVANYPGVESTSGYQLATTMKNQAQRFGCTIRSNVSITRLDLGGETKSVEVNGRETFSAPAVILAPGGRSRTLGVPGEADLRGKGISYCATCDGDFFQDKNIIVVGGGNSALEEAVSLTKYAASVTIVHQFDHFQASAHAVEEAKQNPKISFIMESTIAGFIGQDSLESVRIKHHPYRRAHRNRHRWSVHIHRVYSQHRDSARTRRPEPGRRNQRESTSRDERPGRIRGRRFDHEEIPPNHHCRGRWNGSGTECDRLSSHRQRTPSRRRILTRLIGIVLSTVRM